MFKKSYQVIFDQHNALTYLVLFICTVKRTKKIMP